VSVGQFRPEKDHPLQLRSMHELRQLVSEDIWDNVSKLLKGMSRYEFNNCKVQDLTYLNKENLFNTVYNMHSSSKSWNSSPSIAIRLWAAQLMKQV
jgi:hypothetical protein